MANILYRLARDGDCTLITDDRNVAELATILEKTPISNFDLDTRKEERFARFLRDEAQCVIGLVGDAPVPNANNASSATLSLMLELLAQVPNSKVFVARAERPTAAELSRQVNTRKMYWTEWTSEVPGLFLLTSQYQRNSTPYQESAIIHKYCPKVGVPKDYSLLKVAYCTPSSCKSRLSLANKGSNYSWLDCPSSVRGQNIRIPIGVSQQYRVLFMQAVAGALGARAESVFADEIKMVRFCLLGYHVHVCYFKDLHEFALNILQIVSGNAEMGSTQLFHFFQRYYDFTPIIHGTGTVFMARVPQPVLSFGNVLKPFNATTWLLILSTVFLLCVMFLFTYMIYEKLRSEFVVPEPSKLNFFLYPMFKITEPDPLPWFKGGMSSKLSVFTWSLFALFINMFYLSNLRAYMIMVDYEDPMETLDDVATQGRKVWIPSDIPLLR